MRTDTMRVSLTLTLSGFLAIRLAATAIPPYPNPAYLSQELEFLAPLHDRLTGSPKHNILIDRIHSQLSALGLEVETDALPFVYYDGPLSPPQLTVAGKDVPVTSYAKYSGLTSAAGVSGNLVDLRTSGLEEIPDWQRARDAIALVNITNVPANYSEVLDVWSGSPAWDLLNTSPENSAETLVRNLTVAAEAGLKGVVYAWEGASTGLVEGQWVPFHELYQGVPTVFVQGMHGQLEDLAQAAQQSEAAHIRLEAHMRPRTQARTLYTVIEGTTLKNESVILNTHTDGTNIVEENGYIALMAYAGHLAVHPPRRTTILVFVGQHMHYEAFTQAPYKATSRWLNQHPELWAGEGNAHAGIKLGGQLKAIAGSCAEHLGAMHWEEDLRHDAWYPSSHVEPELLYASTGELNTLLRQHWIGADANVTRVTDPIDSEMPQAGEGYPFFLEGIPNFSLVTNPSYLLKIWCEGFDERGLVNLQAVERQVDSFVRVWSAIDGMSAEEIGVQSTDGKQRELHV